MAAARPTIGELIRRQRELNDYSVREFARLAGISNPYLSQIERGLRAPSDRVLGAIADALDTSAEAIYEEAGIVDEQAAGESEVIAAIRSDALLTERQKRALLETYDGFMAANGHLRAKRR